MKLALATLVALSCSVVFGQTARLEGNVIDPQGAAIPAAEIKVINISTGQTLTTTSDAEGAWVLPFMNSAEYRVSVTKPGFRSSTVEKVKIDAGVPARVSVTLEVGAVSETVEVSAATDSIQASSASVSTTLSGQQVSRLPYVSRNALDLVVSQPGTQTAGANRSSIVMGLPQSTINITLDGVNVQDNLLKNSDGFFTQIQPRTDAIQEVSITQAAGGADSLAEGNTQIRFVTKGGTNEFHGGAFWQDRNTFFNANNYFNNRDGLPRDRLILHQIGVNVGGPILRNKLFFFAYYETFRNPQTNNTTRTVLTDDARAGYYSYLDSANKLQRINLFQLAGTKNGSLPANVRPYATTADPIIAGTLSTIAQLSASGGVLRSLASSGDYDRQELRFQAVGANNRNFPTTRLDWSVTEKHHLEFVYNYQSNYRVPDGLNSVLPIFPGAGAVVGSDVVVGQRGMKFSGVGALRSVLTSHLTSEIRYGLTGGNTLFRDEISDGMFSQWRGYAPSFNYVTNPYVSSSSERRNSPTNQVEANLSWNRSSHLVTFGGSFTQANNWTSTTGTQNVPGISFTFQTGDPLNTGATALFGTDNFPNSSTTQRNAARDLYILLTGRVGSITRSVALDEKTRTYGSVPFVDRNRQREYGFYVQDRWRLASNLTVNAGIRLERQLPLVSINGLYTRVGLDGLYGLSGVGNLFKPGVMTGVAPTFKPIDPGQGVYPTSNAWSPTVGVAWVPPKTDGVLRWLVGSQGRSVLRAGYAIAINRGGLASISDSLGSNQGSFRSVSVNPGNFPAEFGPAGGVLFRDATLPARSVSTQTEYPLAAIAGQSVYDFDPNLKNRYIPSWNISFQREIAKATVLEVSYIANRAKRLWSSINLNEVNVFENGFLDEFKIAQNNLAIANGIPVSQLSSLSVNGSFVANYGNQGKVGQQNIPMIQTALGTSTDQTTAIAIARGEVGEVASGISGSLSRMTSLTNAGKPANLFIVNPTLVNGSANLTTNGFPSKYDSMQVELRRRMSAGLLMQASWVYSHSYTSSVQTLRNLGGEFVPNGQDIRHAIKVNWIYELPFGPGKALFGNSGNRILKTAAGGWQISGVARVQSGDPFRLSSSRNTFNAGDAGVQLYNMTTSQLQDMIQIRKTTVQDPVTLANRGVVYWLPQSLIDNTQAAFETNSKTLGQLDRTKPFIGPPGIPGLLGYNIYVQDPWQQHWDLSLIKNTRIGERQSVEFRAQFLNVFNITNFFLANTNVSGTSFGQTSSAYRDISNTNDPGGRIIEFVLRYSF